MREVVLMGLVGVWATALLVCTLAVRRETAIVLNRLKNRRVPVRDGLNPGTVVPRRLYDPIPEESTLLFLSASCPPCHELINRIGSALDERVTVILKDESEESLGDNIANRIPETVSLRRGAQAEAVRRMMQVDSEPLAIRVSDRIVVAKGYIRHVGDLQLITGEMSEVRL